MAYVTLPNGKEVDIPDYCLDVFGRCENCPRCMDDCDGKEEGVVRDESGNGGENYDAG